MYENPTRCEFELVCCYFELELELELELKPWRGERDRVSAGSLGLESGFMPGR